MERQDTEREVLKLTRTSLTKEMGQTVPSASHVSSGLGAREISRDARDVPRYSGGKHAKDLLPLDSVEKEY
jgi:hypothetical protein